MYDVTFEAHSRRRTRQVGWRCALGLLVVHGVCAAALGACVEDHEQAAAAAGPRGSGALLPWKTGNTWSYRVTSDDEVSDKVVTIGDEEPVGGTGPHRADVAHKVVTRKGAVDQTLSWQVEEDGRVLRYREQSFGAKSGELELEESWDPYKLHIDGSAPHLRAGAAWVEEYAETKQPVGEAAVTSREQDSWSVDAIHESVTVPAGTFDAIVIQKVGGESSKSYWYVPGLGKVKETGGQTEELVSYQVSS